LLLAVPALAQDEVLSRFSRPWRDDPIWYDGQAEIARYDATRTIYGKSRRYVARFFTNKELASPETFTKSIHGGREVFKFHLREDIGTENYSYHYSTMCYVGTGDLKSLKLDAGSQEDCGASFKQYINHAGRLWWNQHSYFPGQGHTSGEYPPPGNLAFFNALPLILRGYPFANPPPVMVLEVIDNQTSTRFSEARPRQGHVIYQDKQMMELPLGRIAAHRLQFYFDDGPPGEARPGEVDLHTYWFAADPQRRHIMLRYQGPKGQTYSLRSVQRRAYWKQGNQK
jgi:hypothetical protein